MLGISKQAVYQYFNRKDKFYAKVEELIVLVDELRSEHPGCGLEKMYYTLRPDFMGRDRFIEVFTGLGYGVKKIKNYIKTTIPTHLTYPNLIEGMRIIRPNQVWQTDITYFYLNGDFYYIVFIIDVYTRQIIGYHVSYNMRVESNIKALKMALKQGNKKKSLYGLIHHSDRGSQYGAKVYLNLLKRYGISVSMGLKGQENAYAERVNGIIKNEYLKRWDIKSYADLKQKLKQAVDHYNEKRIHYSLPDKLTPNKFERLLKTLYSMERPAVNIYSENNPNWQRTKRIEYIWLADDIMSNQCSLTKWQ